MLAGYAEVPFGCKLAGEAIPNLRSDGFFGMQDSSPAGIARHGGRRPAHWTSSTGRGYYRCVIFGGWLHLDG